MDVQPSKRQRLHETEDFGTCVASDACSVEFSSDPSQNERNEPVHYKPMDRAKWITKISTVEAQKNIDNDLNKTVDASSTSSSTKAHKLLTELLQIVQPKFGKATAMRKVVRELRASITSQQDELESHCPKGKISQEIKAWSSGVSGSCKHCGMNHFVVELRRIGQKVYGVNTAERKDNIKKWMDKGTADYVKAMRRAIAESWMGKFFSDISAQALVTKA